ncbi:MAG: hypothetical protein KBG15_09680 [Kofleriaceae bacterium]|nr:hypothetical protein [Kofleriaceae bacterium]
MPTLKLCRRWFLTAAVLCSGLTFVSLRLALADAPVSAEPTADSAVAEPTRGGTPPQPNGGAPPAVGVLSTSEPDDVRGSFGILADLKRIVLAEEANGWLLDRVAINAMYPVVLQTVCRASENARQVALRDLLAQQARVGDPKALYRRSGALTSAVAAALHVQRMHATLQAVVDGAAADCPFYLRPQRGYDGRQTDRNRMTLSMETGGLVQFRYTNQEFSYGGGGGLRILPGYGFGRWSLLGGLELSGGAMVKANDTSKFVLNYFPALPVVVRLRGTMWHADVEAAAVSLLQGDNTNLSFGGRLGVGIGISALRTRFIIPWAGIGIAYEYFAESGGRSAASFVRGGFRLGFQWAP